MKLMFAFAVALISVLPANAFWWGRNNEGSAYHACGLTLDLLVSEVCADTWNTRCNTSCRRKREANGHLQTFQEEQKAKAFLVHRARTKRDVWSLKEECCSEGCQVEEVREHC